MANVANSPTTRKPQYRCVHYAYYGDLYGTAEFVSGSGYLFRREGERQAVLVSYKDPDLMLLGLCAVADAQHDVDLLVGGSAAVACSRQMEVA